jgi:hypothetical protein
MSDTAGYSDLVFGLFWLLGYQFSPRLADFGEARFWRMDPKADYGALNGLARQRINIPRIERSWDDLLRVAGSLKMGTVSASELIRGSRAAAAPRRWAGPSASGPRGQDAVPAELPGRRGVSPRILTQLNRGESRHGVARAIFHGQRGELRQRYREGRRTNWGRWGWWSTRWCSGTPAIWTPPWPRSAPPAWWSSRRTSNGSHPLLLDHVNVLGRYEFALKESVRQGQLRPLRDPRRAG